MRTPPLTIFTPTYNRAYCLHKCYESLCRQTCKDFIWLIIDDGSTDNTKQLVDHWISQENGFEIKYIWKKNGGLYTAYNAAIAKLGTMLAVCIDSDDWMPDNAVDVILCEWNRRGNEKVAGLAGLDCLKDGTILGDPFPAQETINLISLATGRYRIKNGDRKLVLRTEVYRSVTPMKEYPGEKNFNPHYMHLQISQKYDFLVVNQPFCVVEYQSDGMTNSIFKQYLNSPNGFRDYRLLELSFPHTPLSYRIKKNIHYISSCILAGKPCISASPCKLLTLLLYPLGSCFSLYIKYRGK